jgi:hypothetical protein
VVSINTNADSVLIRSFAERIDPARIDFINCSLHAQQREERRRTPQFIRNVTMLRAAGFPVFSSCVMYPGMISRFPEIWETYAKEGIILIPKALQGRHRGQDYPGSYTPEERRLFVAYSERAGLLYAHEMGIRLEPPTINPLRDPELFLRGSSDFRGSLCEAGRRFVRIWENGEICRCGRNDVLGNIAQGWFSRRLLPAACSDTECLYFCDKYRL